MDNIEILKKMEIYNEVHFETSRHWKDIDHLKSINQLIAEHDFDGLFRFSQSLSGTPYWNDKLREFKVNKLFYNN